MIEIPLTQGQVAIIDDEDYDLVNQYTWHAHKCKREGEFYAEAYVKLEDGHTIHTNMSRLIMGFPDAIVDHRNGNSLDHRRCNLRICTYTENTQNSRKRFGASSKFKGVQPHKPTGTWYSGIVAFGEGIHLGYYKNEEDAALVYDAAARLFHGEFARLNFPTEGEQQA